MNNDKVLVTDFDGTLTRRDFYQLVAGRLLSPGTPDFWAEYRAGRLSHFEALRRYFAAAEGGEAALIAIARDMGLEPDLKAEVSALKEAGWAVVVVSAGCLWYIGRLLKEAGVDDLPVFANPGHIDEDGRLVLERPPADSPFTSRDTGIDKAAVVRAAMAGGRTVAFAGDGPPDLDPALLVPGDLRFARGHLAEALAARGEPFRPFDRWADVARALRQP